MVVDSRSHLSFGMDDELISLLNCVDDVILAVHDILQKEELNLRWPEIFSKQLNMEKISDEKIEQAPAIFEIYRRYIESSADSMLKICLITYHQSKCPLWFDHREKRISATKAHDIYKGQIHRWPKLLARLLNGNFRPNEAMIYGKQNEKVALKCFIAASGYRVLETGLFICYRQPWLCCSPDGLFINENSELVLLEIKCPYSCRDMELADFSRGVCNVYYLFVAKDRAFLKKNHQYYSQIQIQLYVTGAAYCLLYVYSSKQRLTVRIEPDPVFWAQAIPKLERFYFEFYLPHIYNHKMLE